MSTKKPANSNPQRSRAWLDGSCGACVYYLAGQPEKGMCRRRAQYVPRRSGETCGEFERK